MLRGFLFAKKMLEDTNFLVKGENIIYYFLFLYKKYLYVKSLNQSHIQTVDSIFQFPKLLLLRVTIFNSLDKNTPTNLVKQLNTLPYILCNYGKNTRVFKS